MNRKERKRKEKLFLEMTWREKRGAITLVRPMMNVIQELTPGTFLSSPEHGVFQVVQQNDYVKRIRYVKPYDEDAPDNEPTRRYTFTKGDKVEFYHPAKGWLPGVIFRPPSKTTNRWIVAYEDETKFASVYPWMIRGELE